MPMVDDYSEDDENGQLAERGRIGAGGQSGQSAQSSQSQPESQFVPWSRFVNANADVSQREAGKLASQVQGDVDSAQQGREAASSAQSNAIKANYTKTEEPREMGSPVSTGGFAQGPAKFGQNATAPAGAMMQPPSGAQTMSLRPPAPKPQPTQSMMQRPGPRTDTITPGKIVPGGQLAGALPGIDPDRLATDLSSGAPHTTGSGITGGKDLEAQLGTDAWQKLVGDTMKAGQEANALGSDSGVQALLGQNGTAFDAALIGGAGGRQFDALAKQYGDGQLGQQLQGANQSAQDAWSKLMGDIDAAASGRDASIMAANADMERIAKGQQVPPELQQKIDESKSWLEEHFPVPDQFKDQQSFTDWVLNNRNGEKGQNAQQGGYSNLLAWADQIYGGATQENIDKFYADIRRMTPEEYQAFMYGKVPAWMGLGEKAAGYNGGKFYGLGPTGNRYSAETTGKATAENQKFWSEWRAGLEVFYQTLAVIATAFATIANPAAGAAVGAATQGWLAAEKAMSNGGAQLEDEEDD